MRVQTVKTSRISPFFLVTIGYKKNIVSNLSSHQETRIHTNAQSAHKTKVTAPAIDFVTQAVCSNQPHQLSPLGLVLWLMEGADTSSCIFLMLATPPSTEK